MMRRRDDDSVDISLDECLNRDTELLVCVDAAVADSSNTELVVRGADLGSEAVVACVELGGSCESILICADHVALDDGHVRI